MQGHHWIMMLVVFLAGYVFARYFPQLGNMVGVP